jgi:hypothetical protein
MKLWKILIFYIKYGIYFDKKNLASRSSNFDHCIHFSPSLGNIRGQAGFNREDIAKKKYFLPKK